MHVTWNSTLVSGRQGSGNKVRQDATRCISRRGINAVRDSENENDMVEGVASTTSPRSTEIFLSSSVIAVARKRFVVLAALLALQSSSQLVLQQYEELIKNRIVVVLFMSMVVGAGGNAGNQAAVSVITALLATRNGNNVIHSSDRYLEVVGKRSTVEKEHSIAVLITTAATVVPKVHVTGRSIWARFLNYTLKLFVLPLVLLRRRWRRVFGDTEYRVGISFISVLRFELVAALCCGVIITGFGALRVGFVLWWGGGDLVSNWSSNSGASSQLSTEWRRNGAIIIGISLSLFIVVFLSVLIGATLPFILLNLGANIEHAAPIVQVLMDLLGTWICCIICNLLLPSVVGSQQTARVKR